MQRAISMTLVLGAFALSACAARTDTAPPEVHGPEPVNAAPLESQPVVDPAPEAEPTGTAEVTDATGNVAVTLKTMGNFDTFLRVVDQAALSEHLVNADLVTVFAPTDEAFAAWPAGKLDKLMGDNTELVKFVNYHLISGKYTGRELVDLRNQKTMNGAEIMVTASTAGGKESIRLNQANVTMPDLKATNGMIHVIDAPLMPPEQASVSPEQAGSAGKAAKPRR